MSEEVNEVISVEKFNEEPKPEDPKNEEETKDEPPKVEEKRRVEIREIAQQMTECQDCKKPMNMKTLRYTHPTTCEGKPSDITQKPVRKSNLKQKIKVQNIAQEDTDELNEPQIFNEKPVPVAKTPVPTVPQT